MTTIEKEKKFLERLLVDERSVLEKLANQAQGIVGIDKDTGGPVILAPKTKLTDREQIFLMLLGSYFSYKLGKSKSESLSTNAIAEGLGLDYKAASARLSELKRERVVETVAKGEHRIVYANAESMLAGVKSKLAG